MSLTSRLFSVRLGSPLFAAFLATTTPLAAQTGTVTGRVVDSQTLQPIAAVQIFIADLDVGVLTQQNGTYLLINVPVGSHVVRAERIGYRAVSQEVSVTDGATVTADFAVTQDALALDAVVVTGTAGGTQRRAIGNVVTQVSAADVTQTATVTNMIEMLGARAPGLQFVETTGVVGAGSGIRIRGVGSVSLGSQPIIFIDGVRASNRDDAGPLIGGGASATALDDVNPNDIESIEIIKGPAAATLYGTEASAGVIQIITKRGAAGAPQWDMTVHQGIRRLNAPADKLGTMWGCRSAPTPPCPLDDIFTYNMYDEANNYVRKIHEQGTSGLYAGGPTEWNTWQCDELLCDGHMQTYSLSVRGGTQNIRYFVSGEYLGDNGVLPWNTNDRVNLRANLNALLSENFTLDVSTGITDGDTRFATPVTGQGDVWDDMQWSNGYCLDRINPGACPRLGGFQERLPSDINGVQATREWTRFVGSISTQHVFRDWLTQRLVFGLDKAWETNTNLFPLDRDQPAYREQDDGSIRYDRPIDGNLTLDYAASALTPLNESLSFTTSVGVQYYERLVETFRNTGRGFALPVQTTVNQTQASQAVLDYTYIQNKSLGAYIQEEIGWNSRVFLTLAMRADDNSAFGSNFDVQTYPKVSGTWVLSEEPFWNFPLVNTLRLRTAWGKAGRQPDTFDGRTVWRSYTGPLGEGAVAPESPGNPDIGPEVSSEIEAGFDVAILNDRISAEFTYFTRKTEDALLDTTLPPSYAQPGDIARNLGRIDNWGWEANLDARVFSRSNVALDLTLAADHVDNEIKDLGDFPGDANIQLGFPYPNEANYFNVIDWSDELDEFGEPVEVFCDGGTGPNGRHPGGEPVDCNSMRDIRLLEGPAFYTHTFTISPTLTLFNNIRIFALAQGMYGKVGNEAQVHWGLRYNNGYCGQAATNDLACVEWLVKNRDGMFRDERIQSLYKADFWKLREVTLQFDLPAFLTERLRANRASLSLSGRELGTLWRAQSTLSSTAAGSPGRNIPDPEFQGLYRFPGLASYTATIRVSF